MEINKRTAIFDDIIDACRMLPEPIQALLMVFLMPAIGLLATAGFENILIAIMVIEVLFIAILIQKNIVYRRISKLENTIQQQIIWVKSKLDAQKKYRYTIISLIFLVIIIIVQQFVKHQDYLIIVSLLWILYSLKSLFYVPLIFIRIIDEHTLELVNDFHQVNLSFKVYEIEKIAFKSTGVKIMESNAKAEFLIEFANLEERKRLVDFFKGTLKHVEIKA